MIKITSDFLKSLKSAIKKSEGFRPDVYMDSEGVPTIGYGFTRIEEDEADLVLQLKLKKIIERDLLLFTKEIAQMNESRLMVFIEMLYQLGLQGVKGFKKMRQAVRDKDWKEVNKQMIDSKWHKQTPNRCRRLAAIMESGKLE